MKAVLVVEDDEGDALLVSECLVEAGFGREDVVWRRSLADGLAALVVKPLCVLLDLGLPDAAGLDALHDLVDRAGDTPVIVLTGRHDGTGDEAVAAGAQDYLVKDDITADLLARSIRYAVERARAQAAEVQLRAQRLLAAENARLERGLLPVPLLRSERVSCDTHYRPGSDMAVLGGDFFDIVETPDGRVRAVIGDVMGHGPDEAALGVHLRVAWRTLVLAGVDDDEILANLARLLKAESGAHGGFVTACDVVIEADRAVMRVAGHPPPLVAAAGRAGFADVRVGPPLGLEHLLGRGDGPRWPRSHVDLPAGSSLILYTDGLLECYRDPDDRSSVGVDELLDAARRVVRAEPSVSAWIPTIVGTAPTGSADDTAVIVLSVGAGEDPGHAGEMRAEDAAAAAPVA